MASLAERDRRYSRVRSAMQERGLEALLVKGSGGHYPAEGTGNFRYLTDIINPAGSLSYAAYVVLPAGGEPVLYSNGRHDADSLDVPWIADVRAPRGPYAREVARTVRELGLARARIGIVGLQPDSPTVADGPISYMFFEALRSELPDSDLIDATHLMTNARTIKSAEEIAGCEAAEELCAGAFWHLAELCGPGVPVREAFAEMQRYILANGADPDSMVGVNCFPEPTSRLMYTRSLKRTMQPGDFITSLSYVFRNGFTGHDHAFVSVGPPRPESVRLVEVARDATEALLASVRPGARSDEVIAAAHDVIESRGLRAPGGDMHHAGLEIPEMCGPAYQINEGFEHLPRRRRPYRFEAGMVLALQVQVADADGRSVEGGTSYAVTEDGYRQLGHVPVLRILEAGRPTSRTAVQA